MDTGHRPHQTSRTRLFCLATIFCAHMFHIDTRVTPFCTLGLFQSPRVRSCRIARLHDVRKMCDNTK